MKRLIISLFLLSTISLIAFAYDGMWGGRLDFNLELPEVMGSTASIHSEDHLSLWYRGTWGDVANLEIEGGVGGTLDFIMGLDTDLKFEYKQTEYTIYPELDLLNIYGTVDGWDYRAGRFFFSDPASLVISTPADGVSAYYSFGSHFLGMGVGYAGLTFNESVEYYLTQQDVKNIEEQLLANARLMEFLHWSMPGALAEFQPSVYFLGLQDLSSSASLAEDDVQRLQTYYAQAMVRGNVGGRLLYEVAASGQYGKYGSSQILAGAARTELAVALVPSLWLTFEGLVSTGDVWSDRDGYLLGGTVADSLNQYLPVSTVATRGYVVEFELGNLTSFGLGLNWKSSETFALELSGTTFLRMANGPVSASQVTSSSGESLFVGQEGLLGFYWRPTSDFGWNLKAGVLYPGSPIVIDANLKRYLPVLFKMGFDVSWSF